MTVTCEYCEALLLRLWLWGSRADLVGLGSQLINAEPEQFLVQKATEPDLEGATLSPLGGGRCHLQYADTVKLVQV